MPRPHDDEAHQDLRLKPRRRRSDPTALPRHDLRRERAMHISGESLAVILLVGLIAEWLAGQLVQGTGFGLVGDLVIGVVGALIASLLFPRLGIRLGSGIVAAILSATIGAVILLLIARIVRGRGRW